MDQQMDQQMDEQMERRMGQRMDQPDYLLPTLTSLLRRRGTRDASSSSSAAAVIFIASPHAKAELGLGVRRVARVAAAALGLDV